MPFCSSLRPFWTIAYAAVDLAVDATHRQVKRQKVADDTFGSDIPQVTLLRSAQHLLWPSNKHEDCKVQATLAANGVTARQTEAKVPAGSPGSSKKCKLNIFDADIPKPQILFDPPVDNSQSWQPCWAVSFQVCCICLAACDLAHLQKCPHALFGNGQMRCQMPSSARAQACPSLTRLSRIMRSSSAACKL